MPEVCFVDTETTGLHPTRHEIWEVGLILPDGSEHQWFLPVEHLDDADPMALNIGRFHERHPDGNAFPKPCCKAATTSEDSLHHFQNHVPHDRWRFAREFCRLTHGLHLAGAVVSFDAERLATLLRKVGFSPSWHYHLIDVEALAAGSIMGSWRGHQILDLPPDGDAAMASTLPWNSQDLSRALGVYPDCFDRHTALGDCRWAKAIYEAVMGSA